MRRISRSKISRLALIAFANSIGSLCTTISYRRRIYGRQSLIKRVIKFRQSDDYIDRTLGAEYTRAQKLAYEHKATVQRRAEEEFRRLEAQEQARREFELEKLRLQVQISQGPLRKISRKSYLQRQPRGSTTYREAAVIFLCLLFYSKSELSC